MRITYTQKKTEKDLPKNCSYCAGVGSSISFKIPQNLHQDTDGSVRCQNCGHNFGFFEKGVIPVTPETRRDDNILPM